MWQAPKDKADGTSYSLTRIKKLPGCGKPTNQGLYFMKRVLLRMDAAAYDHDASGWLWTTMSEPARKNLDVNTLRTHLLIYLHNTHSAYEELFLGNVETSSPHHPEQLGSFAGKEESVCYIDL